jgi:hypothetical protein
MVKKLAMVLLAAVFSLSVSRMSFAAEEKKATEAPAKPAEKAAPVNPCAGKEEMKEKKAAKKKVVKKKKAAKKATEEATGTSMAPEKPAKPAETPKPEKK